LESNWRYNIPLVGWSGGPFHLIARLRSNWLPYTHMAAIAGTNTQTVWLGIADVRGYVPTWDFWQSEPRIGFPWAYNPFPD
jgi:hypothetical protein